MRNTAVSLRLPPPNSRETLGTAYAREGRPKESIESSSNRRSALWGILTKGNRSSRFLHIASRTHEWLLGIFHADRDSAGYANIRTPANRQSIPPGSLA